AREAEGRQKPRGRKVVEARDHAAQGIPRPARPAGVSRALIGVDIGVRPVLEARRGRHIGRREIVLPLTRMPMPVTPWALAVIVPLLAIPWPIVLFVTTTDAVTVTPLTVTALPGLTVPSLVTAPDTFAALTTIDVTVVLAGL